MVVEQGADIVEGEPNLLAGCEWDADWLNAINGPTFAWQETECPGYLIDKYSSTINTMVDNRFKHQEDWSVYVPGDIVESVD